ncbi:MAG: type II secretion system protein [Bacilli bacterium]|jgi:prepilin-type N-terminal cleavage/methylation domain-containing protein|nr:type II secretion system protein [Bacilli bacterium]
MKLRGFNRKGFTLIELLAVISILAILMLLATGSVTSMITKSQKRAFVIDANNVVETAKTAYMDALLNGNLTGSSFCMSIDYLKNKSYLDKIGSAYVGSVQISVSNDVATYKIWLSNGKQQVVGAEYSKIEEQTVEYSAAASVNCGGSGTLLS